MDTIKRMWTDEDLVKFKELYPFSTTKELSLIFNRTIGSLSDKANELGLYKNKFNEHYFDSIDSSDKAYWIGFIWCDGSMIHRIRKNGMEEYNLKISLMESDKPHLEKFLDCIDGNYYKVNIYNSKSGYKDNNKESRVFITSQYLGKLLINKYGIFSNRTNIIPLLSYIPIKYKRDFIRGVLDADGSFQKYINTNKDNGGITTKFNLRFGGSPELLRYIEDYLIEENIINNIERKISKRHEDRDGNYFQLTLSGRPNVLNTLDLLYKDSNIFLNRKYQKYIDMKEGGSNVN